MIEDMGIFNSGINTHAFSFNRKSESAKQKNEEDPVPQRRKITNKHSNYQELLCSHAPTNSHYNDGTVYTWLKQSGR
jgi:hypothetical protein